MKMFADVSQLRVSELCLVVSLPNRVTNNEIQIRSALSNNYSTIG
jgi:hypothetical protein